jgi:TatD DNase family protein
LQLIDSHCHLDDEQFDADRDAVVERALAAGVAHLLVIGTGEGPPDLEAGLRMAERYGNVMASVGIHPQHAGKASADDLRRLQELVQCRRVAAVGEIGLDYYWDAAPREVQKRLFIEQLELARARGMAVILHTREAWDDTLVILAEHWWDSGLPAIFHCFTGDAGLARRLAQLGNSYFGIGGIVTFPKATDLQAAVREIPGDRLLLETDAPYLAPVPHRGKRNEPAFLRHTAERVAELRGARLEDLAALTTANFERAFGWRTRVE